MAHDLIALAHQYHAALNALDLAAVEKMLADNAEYHSPSVGGLFGRFAIMNAMCRYFAEYSDQVAEDERVYHAGPDAVRSEWRLRATATSDGTVSERAGIETIFFDHKGLIRRIEVEDRC
jgi:hypothetical protein